MEVLEMTEEEEELTLIVGSRGRMGSMLAREAKKAGLAAVGVDFPYDREALSACAKADLVIVCVPAANFAETLRQITPAMKKTAILADITSVKEKPMRVMADLWAGPSVGTHPLFGPKFVPGDDLPTVLTRGKNASDAHVARVANFFKAIGCRVFEADADAHDKAMARIQNLNYITNLAYFAALAKQKDLLPFVTPSFRRRMNAASKMLTEDAEMFAGLFEANSHSHEAVREFRKALNVAASGDLDLLKNRAQWWWREKKE